MGCLWWFGLASVAVGARAQANFSASVQYNEVDAKAFASLSSATYCEDTSKLLDWSCGACKDSKTPLVPGKIRIVDGNSLRVVIGKLKEQHGCLVAFRGSSNVQNWISDFQAWQVYPSTYEECDGCEVHGGFYALWKDVRGATMNSLKDVGCAPTSSTDNLVYVTGHSLGAAMTHLAMFTLHGSGFVVPKSYSFEAPRVGNMAFSDAFTRKFTRNIPVFRVTHYKDPVVHLPPHKLLYSYTHVNTEVFYDGSGGHKVCSQTEDPTCADQYDDIPIDLLYVGDHCGSQLVPNGDICNPQGCDRAQSSRDHEVHV